MPPAARVTDMHACPMQNPGPVPHVGGPILPAGEPTVLIGFLPAARLGDMATCAGPPDTIIKGSATVMIGYMPAARMGDSTAHGGSIVVGHPTTLIGDAGSGGGGGGGGAGGGGGDGDGADNDNQQQQSQGDPGQASNTSVSQGAYATQMKNAAGAGTPLCEVCPQSPPAESDDSTEGGDQQGENTNETAGSGGQEQFEETSSRPGTAT